MRKMKLWRQAVSLVMAFAMTIGMCQPALAAGAEDTLNYVSIGASQTNGYGMRYYLPKEVYEVPTSANKDALNIYGYGSEVADAYPNLVKEALEAKTGKATELEQLAISSMRAEEVHILLDNEYYGDAYTNWRFIGGQNWFAKAHKDGLEGLRKDYQEHVANADVISLDIGVNNFGVYAINRITTGGRMYESDLSKVFDEATLAKYNEIRAKVYEVLAEKSGADLADQLDFVVETLTYALVGFMNSFDEVVKHIYELNPDAQIVVVGLPNMMQGTVASFKGVTIPFGEIFGKIIDMANLYTSSLSPYADTYAYAYVGEDGTAETFLTDIAEYTGNPEDLDDNMKDCFDVYDNNMFIRSRVQFIAYTQGIEYLQYAYGAEKMPTPASATEAEMIKCVNAFQVFFEDQKNGFAKFEDQPELKAALEQLYTMYQAALAEAYDVVATILQEGAKRNFLDLDTALDSEVNGKAEDDVMDYIFDSVEQGITSLLTDSQYAGYELDTEMFDNNTANATVLAMGVRFDLGNSFFAHPNVDGHKEIAAAIMDAYNNGTLGKDVAKNEIKKALKDIVEYIDENGAELLAEAYQYALEEGYIDELKEAVAELEAEIKAESKEVVAEIKAEIAELEAELAELEAKLEAATDKAEAEIKAKIAEIEAKIAELEAKIAEIEKKVNEAIEAIQELNKAINNFVAAVEEGIKSGINAAVEEIQKALDAVAEAVKVVNEVVAELNAAIDDLQELAVKVEEAAKKIEEKVNALIEAYEATFAAELEVDEDLYYIGFGDTVASEEILGWTYVDYIGTELADKALEELGKEVTVDYANMAAMGLSVTDLLDGLATEEIAAEVASADLVTVGFSMKGLIEAAFTTTETDWVQYFGEDGAAYVEKAIADVTEELLAGGLDAQMAEMLLGIVEAFPYVVVEYAANYHEIAAQIHEINPEAVVVLTGMYNPFEGYEFDNNGEVVAVGEFMDALIEVSNAHLRACAMLSENTIFVEAAEVDTILETEVEEELEVLSLLLAALDFESELFHPCDDAHNYIKEQIFDAITMVNPEEEPGLLGDVNLDGVIDTSDAQAIFNYFMGITTEGQEFDAASADLNGDGFIDTSDAQAAFNMFMGII